MLRFLNSDLTYNLPVIMKAAWLRARHAVAIAARPMWPFKARVVSLREAFAAELRRTWDDAKAERCMVEWRAAQAADAARRAALPQRERDIENARLAVEIAEHSDSFTAAGRAAQAAAQARLASLLHAA